MNFEWNERKAELNLKKHHVSFEEAKTVFNDLFYLDFYDPDHSDGDHRYIIIGHSCKDRILMVSYTERGAVLRLISARKATLQEQEVYHNGQF